MIGFNAIPKVAVVPILVLWFMIIIVLIANRFWPYWSSLY